MYGGAFSPPHLGHTGEKGILGTLLSQVAEKVILIPTGFRTDKQYDGVSGDDRIHMLRLATEEYRDRVEIDTHFLKTNTPTTTRRQAQYLFTKYKKEIPQVFGSDVAPHMRSWEPDGYVSHVLPKIFFLRPGYPIPEGEVTNYEVLDCSPCTSSSTSIRRKIQSVLDGK